MWIVALLSLAVALTGQLAPEPDPLRPGARGDRSSDPRDPCGREGWVGDGEGGRDPPPCDDGDGADAALEPPGWRWRDEDAEDEDEDRAGYER